MSVGTVANPISGIAESPRGPDNRLTAKGRAFSLLDLGTFDLTTSGADIKKWSVPRMTRGRIIGIYAVCETVTTDTNADGTITAEINGTAVTGGVVTIADTADGTNPFDTAGKVFQGTVITAANTFDGNDYIDIAWATSNAFSDGVARVILVIETGLNA